MRPKEDYQQKPTWREGKVRRTRVFLNKSEDWTKSRLNQLFDSMDDPEIKRDAFVNLSIYRDPKSAPSML